MPALSRNRTAYWRVRLQTASKAILLYSASDIDILTAEQVANHPFLQRVDRTCWT
ncbi:endonuclease VIII [Klebsiella pneumoniae]|uniref:Endonuclease VIII n=1 Tax=Klebsiella pneumoniae TaxID=573 RepID=A0A378FN16_KLEPN|nr:endonuclease VIII [Klebsiella pneumoniae]